MHCIYHILYIAISNHVWGLSSKETMGVAKLMPEFWVSGTTVPTLIKAKFPILLLQQKVRTKCLKEYVKIMALSILFPACRSLVAEATDFLCAHFNKL